MKDRGEEDACCASQTKVTLLLRKDDHISQHNQ